MLMHDRWTGDYATVAEINAGDEARIGLDAGRKFGHSLWARDLEGREAPC
jgi:hypothetical protein